MDCPKPLWKQRLFSAFSVFNTLEAQLQHCSQAAAALIFILTIL